jgi:hypothetical protein
MVALLAAAGNLTVLASQILVGVTWNVVTVPTLSLLLMQSVLLRTACPEDPLPIHSPVAASGRGTLTWRQAFAIPLSQ